MPNTVKERLKALIDEMPEQQAERLERTLGEMVASADAEEWTERALRLFDVWYADDETVYTLADAQTPGQ